VVCRLMDSLEIFSKVPVDPDTYYLVGLQVYGVPGFDFLSPIGTSGVTIAAALNPCVGGWLAGVGGRAYHAGARQGWRASVLYQQPAAGRQPTCKYQCRHHPISSMLSCRPHAAACRGLFLCIRGAPGGHQGAHPGWRRG
jgi:hypothetical protein